MRSVVVVLPASMWATMPMLRTCVSVLSDIRTEIIAYLVAGDVAVDDIGDARADTSTAPTTPNVLSAPMVGRDVPGAPRQRDDIGDARTPKGRRRDIP